MMDLSLLLRDCSQLTPQPFTQLDDVESAVHLRVTLAFVTTSMAFSGASWSMLSLT